MNCKRTAGFVMNPAVVFKCFVNALAVEEQ